MRCNLEVIWSGLHRLGKEHESQKEAEVFRQIIMATLVGKKRGNWFKARVGSKQCLVAGKLKVYFGSKHQNRFCQSLQMENFNF